MARPDSAPTAGTHRTTVLAAHAVSRRFGDAVALKDVSLAVRTDEVHVVLGPRGAGKTTLVRILAGLSAPSDGYVTHDGKPVRARQLRARIGLVTAGDQGFYPRLSGVENLAFYAGLNGLRRRRAVAAAKATLESTGLLAQADCPIALWSSGMRRRLAIARAMLSEPQLLLLDDPTQGLNADDVQRVRLLVSWFASRGVGVLWTTRQPQELHGLADRVTFLIDGTIYFAGHIGDLVPAGGPRYALRLRSSRPLGPVGRARLQSVIGPAAIVTLPEAADPEHVILEPRSHASLADALSTLVLAGFDVVSCRRVGSEVEERFITLAEAHA